MPEVRRKNKSGGDCVPVLRLSVSGLKSLPDHSERGSGDRHHLTQLATRDARIAARIGEHQRIIAFRNILIHGYADVDDRLVWDIVGSKLGDLRGEVANSGNGER